MSYVNLNNPANFQLQEFEQLGFRYIVSGRPSIGGETYRTLFVLEEAVVTTTSPEGDSFSSETLAAGTVIHGFFSDVSTTSGALLAYKAGPITAQEIWDFYRAYVESNGGVIEGESCAVTEIAALLAEGLYSMASLVLIPSGYKTGVVYSERPTTTDGQLTFTRNSNATRVNSSGLVEKVKTNLLTHSNDFSNANWIKDNGATVTAGQSGYDGSTNAWKLEAPTAGGSRDIYQIYAASAPLTFSLYAKAGTTDWIRINLSGIGNQYFNLGNGTAGSGSGIPYSITPAGNGYYRISISGLTGSITAVYIFIAAGDVDINVSAGDNVYIQNSQLEVSDFGPTAYIPTTTSARSTFAGISVDGTSVPNVPRLDYSGGATCGKLLLEGQRTNLALWSEQIDNAAWSKANATITANSVTSPSGYQDADLIITATTSSVQKYAIQTISVSAGGYTTSFFVKANTYGSVAIVSLIGGTINTSYFNITSGTKGTTTAGTTSTIENYGNGWYRITQTATETTTANRIVGIYFANSALNSISYAGSLTDSFYLWGAQLEAGSYATSYIPTLGASVTRLADSASRTNIANLIGQTEGTMFWDGTIDNFSNFATLLTLEGVSNSWIYLLSYSGGLTFEVRSNNIVSASYVSAITTGAHKIALAYDASQVAIYIDGVSVYTDYSVTIPATSNLYLAGWSGYNQSIKTSQALLFKTRLTNAQLAELTTL